MRFYIKKISLLEADLNFDFPNSDLSSNYLNTLHKDSFRGLTNLEELDLSHNLLDYLPDDLLMDLDSLTKL